MSDDDAAKKLLMRIGYLSERIDEFLSEAKTLRGRELCCVNAAAQTLAEETFALEEKYISPYVQHPAFNTLLCRHKIIAATQCAIMSIAPFRNNETELLSISRAKVEGAWTPNIRNLNARFAQAVAVHMLKYWMIEYSQPQKSLDCLDSEDLLQTYRENTFWLEHSLMPTSVNDIPRFPFLLLAQFWSMIDRYATVQGGGVFPAYKEDNEQTTL